MPQAPSLAGGPEGNFQPRAFISYSWTSPGHQEQVRKWAERLLSDGVDVVMDIFDLKEGHDKYHFMERMVTDSAITHVLVFCDKGYAEKADAKKAGVGTESQIISSEVYAKVSQSKFIPIICQFADEREPYMPVFLRSRIWIDFSSTEAANQNWEKLVRLLHGKPAHQKPQVGNAPAYLSATIGPLTSPASGKLANLRQAFTSNARGLDSYREDFLTACISYADSLRVRKDPRLDLISMGQKVLDDCGELKVIRNLIVDWVLLESGTTASEDFTEALLKLLEELLELKSRPKEINSWSQTWFEGQAVFVYETFLYIVAALLKTASYSVLHEVFASHYLCPLSERNSAQNFVNFGAFYGYSESLESVLGRPGRKLNSPAAELLKRQADRTDLPFKGIIEAELVVFLAALVTTEIRWYPQTLHYNSGVDFAFFIRATQHRHFLKLATIVGMSDGNAVREAVKAGSERLHVNEWPGFFMLSRSFWECMNLSQLDSLT